MVVRMRKVVWRETVGEKLINLIQKERESKRELESIQLHGKYKLLIRL